MASDDQTSEPDAPFWRKPLEELTPQEWEALCDGCGRCCLVKLEDEDDGKIYFTDIGCRLLDGQTCQCRNYPERQKEVPDCIRLTLQLVDEIPWLPPTCAYRLRRLGLDLPSWHPLVSGDPESVHKAGVSVQSRISGSETEITGDDMIDHIVAWPARWPRTAARARKPKIG